MSSFKGSHSLPKAGELSPPFPPPDVVPFSPFTSDRLNLEALFGDDPTEELLIRQYTFPLGLQLFPKPAFVRLWPVASTQIIPFNISATFVNDPP